MYCVYSDIINGVKLGYWESTLKILKKRHVTYYSNNLTMLCVKTFLPHVVEKNVHKRFKHHRITNEIFKKKTIWMNIIKLQRYII